MGKGHFGRLCRRERMTNKGYQNIVGYDHVRIMICQLWNIIRAIKFVRILKHLGFRIRGSADSCLVLGKMICQLRRECRYRRGKNIPLTVREGPRGFETSRLPHFLNDRLTVGGKDVSRMR
jgi:hypothetical protein